MSPNNKYTESLIKSTGDDFDEEEEYDEDNLQPEEFKYPPITFYVLFCLMVSCQALGFGTTVSFTGPTLDNISTDLNLCGTTDDDDDGDDEALCNKAAFVAAVYAIGGMVGALLAGPLVNLPALGRRPVYLTNLSIFISGYTLIGLSQTYTQIIVGRLLTGFATGVTGVVTPMYIGEISPAPYRGVLGSFFNCLIAAGILGVNLLTYLGVGWRSLALYYGTLPQGVILVFFLSEKLFPESPEHLTSLAVNSQSSSTGGIRVQPLDVLRLSKTFERLHGLTPSEGRLWARSSVATKLRDSELMVSISETLEGNDKVGGYMCFHKYWWAIVLALGVTSGFALSAINCISAFTATIFLLADEDPGSGNVGFASVQLGVAVFGVFFLNERFGRKALLMSSALGCTLGHLLIFSAFSFHLDVLATVGVMVFIASVSIGLSSLSWVYASEVLPGAVRPLGMALCGAAFWGISFILNYEFPGMIVTYGKTGAFLIFASLSFSTFLFIALSVFETNGKTLGEIEATILSKNKPNM